MILKSDYYTHAQFCSPCVPGAGNLDSPCDSGEKAYCLGHDWFEDGIAPYPVYRVSDNARIEAKREDVTCPNCEGTGKDTVYRLATVRQCTRSMLTEEDHCRHRIGQNSRFKLLQIRECTRHLIVSAAMARAQCWRLSKP